MKVLFLDLDGVVNSADYMEHRRHLPRPTQHSIDAPTVPRLNAITDRTGAKIVISSSWRLARYPDHDPGPVWRLRRILAAHGVTGDIIDVTPHLLEQVPGWVIGKGRERGYEIQAWLDGHPEVTSFAILDDDSDMVHLALRHVKTSWKTGLLDEHVERVIAMLSDAENRQCASLDECMSYSQ